LRISPNARTRMMIISLAPLILIHLLSSHP